jgi:hypothetical protein
MKLIEVRDDFPAGFHDALGRFAVAFGRVEYEIKLAVKSLSGKKFSEGMVDAESSGAFGRLCRKAKQYANKKLDDPQLSTFHKLMDAALKLAPDRNDTLHAMWTTDGQGEAVRYRPYLGRKQRNLKWRSRPVPLAELHRLEAELLQLWKDIRAQKKAWPPLRSNQ